MMDVVVKPYGEVFTKIKKEVIEETQKLIKSGIWKRDVGNEDKAIAMGIWIQKVSEYYEFDEVPKFYFVDGEDGKIGYKRHGGGCYIPYTNEIYLFRKPSLVTLLHEFRHAMQYQTIIRLYKGNIEEDARAWSHSLYRLSAPNSYKKAIEQGLLHHN